MGGTLLSGIIVVNIALVFYLSALITVSGKEMNGGRFLSLLLAGVFFDITATALMISGSSQGPLTLHGLIGYSSLGAMICETVVFLHFFRKFGTGKRIGKTRRRVFMFVFVYWVLAYITGAALIVLRK